MKKLLQIYAGIVTIILTPAFAFAHAGHGHDNPLSPGHFVSNPEHALPALLSISVMVAGMWFLYKKFSKVKGK
jgi:hydrogenase/urease accessory protein HupE